MRRIYHVVIRIEELTASYVWRTFSLVWMAWSGPPRRIVFDQQRGFLGEFRVQLENCSVELDFVPRNAHHKLGRAERHNAAWRGIWKHMVDETGIAGSVEVDFGATSVSYAKNSSIRRAGASPQQALFGFEMRIPESLLSSPDDIGSQMMLSQEQLLQRRATIRASALRSFHQYDLEQSIARGVNAQARPYRGDYAPGDVVAVYWKYDGRENRARYLRGHIIGDSAPERPNQTVSDKCWVAFNGRVLLIPKEDMREAFGSEQWSPSADDLEEIRKAESEVRRMRKDGRRAHEPETVAPEDLPPDAEVDFVLP